jgi:hypothetical protein
MKNKNNYNFPRIKEAQNKNMLFQNRYLKKERFSFMGWEKCLNLALIS